MLQIFGMYMVMRTSPWSFLAQKLSMSTASTTARNSPMGTVTTVKTTVLTREAVNHSSDHRSMKFFRPTRFQFPMPLRKFQSVKLMNRENSMGTTLKQTRPTRLGCARRCRPAARSCCVECSCAIESPS